MGGGRDNLSGSAILAGAGNLSGAAGREPGAFQVRKALDWRG